MAITGVIYRGEDDSIILTITNPDGSPRNITNDVITWTAKYHATDASALVTKSTSTTGVTKTTPASGIATVTIDDTDFLFLSESTNLEVAAKVVDNTGKVVCISPDVLPVVVTSGG